MSSPLTRIRLLLAYDGAPYSGWAIQPHKTTVQETLEQALGQLLKAPVRVHASGRTDAGVHARGQVVHFDVVHAPTIPDSAWHRAVNVFLPPSIRVLEGKKVSGDFHARFSAIGKTYTYRLCTEKVLPPFLVGRSWHVPWRVDWRLFEECVGEFEGIHDFFHFSARRGNESEQTNYSRRIFSAGVQDCQGGMISYWRGEGFLYKMVRMMVGSAIEVASGRWDKASFVRLLHSSLREKKGKGAFCAPSDGLVLESVDYP